MKKKTKKEFKMDRQEYIDLLANKTNEISMSNNNSKTGKACLNMAFPLVTCRPDAPCRYECYAGKGCQQIAVVQGAYYRNMRLYYDDPDNFFEQIYCKIKFSGLPKVRWFDSGDIADAEFFDRMVELCKRTPDVKHMAFTKKYEIVNEYIDKNGKLPDNLNVMFSAWHKMWYIPNPHNLGIAYIDFNDKSLNPEFPKNAFICPGRESTCSACGACFNKKLKAVIFHQH
jgi:hypothetical protein